MSFSKTLEQMRAGTKTQTRRLGWSKLRAGDRVLAVEKGQGLRKGEQVRPLYEIEVTHVSDEPLREITRDDVAAEGFPGWSVADFVSMFCELNGCAPSTVVRRICFRRVG